MSISGERVLPGWSRLCDVEAGRAMNGGCLCADAAALARNVFVRTLAIEYDPRMGISITPEQQAWLAAYVARGEFPSVDDAVRQLIDDRMAEERLIEEDDLDWAKPLVDEAIAAADRGDVISREEYPGQERRSRCGISRKGLMARVVVTSLADADTDAVLDYLTINAGGHCREV